MFRTASRRAFSLLEIMVAMGILALCFLPILQHSQATIGETEQAQEQVLARHFLIDMVERYRNSPIEEIRRLPKTEPQVPLGQEPPIVKEDAVLSDRERVATALTAAGATDSGAKGFQRYMEIAKLMKFTRVAWYEEAPPPSKLVTLHCKVRWESKLSKGEKFVEVSKLLVN